MPRHTITVETFSKLPTGTVSQKIERVARDSMFVEVKNEHVRVIVRALPTGGMLVETYRLAKGADPSDRDPIIWNDDATLHLPAERERPTLAEITPDTFLTTSEPLAF